MHVLSSALPAPLVLQGAPQTGVVVPVARLGTGKPGEEIALTVEVPVARLGTGKPGEEITLTVCEMAPGAYAGPHLRLNATIDCVLPVACVDLSSGVAGADGILTLFGHVCFAFTSVATPPDAKLHVTLRDGTGAAETEPILVRGRSEAWHYIPPNTRWTAIELHVEATGCAPSPTKTVRVSIVGAPEYVVRDSRISGMGKAEMLRRAGFTTIWLLRLLDDDSAKEAGLALGEMVQLRAAVRRLNSEAFRMPRPPPPLFADSSATVSGAVRTAASALRGVDEASVAAVSSFLESQVLVTPEVVAEFAAGSHAANDLEKGGVARGLAVGLLQALRHPEVPPPPIPEGGSLGLYRAPPGSGMRVTSLHPGHADRVQYAKWTQVLGGLETTLDVVLRVSATAEEHAQLVEAHTALQDTGAVARCLGVFKPAAGETRYCAVLERLPQSCEDCVCHPDFKNVPAPQRDMYALAIADALAKIHEKGWAHNDVKEANVMFAWDGGRWRAVFIDMDQAMRLHSPLPPQGKMVVTPECASPEYLRRWKGVVGAGVAACAEASADTFCYGLIFARLYGSGARVFPDGETAVEVLLHGDGAVPVARLAGLSAPKQAIVLALCHPKPSARPDMRDVHTRLLASRGMSVVADAVVELGRVRGAAEDARDEVRTMHDVRRGGVPGSRYSVVMRWICGGDAW
jgi:hypothetical protein